MRLIGMNAANVDVLAGIVDKLAERVMRLEKEKEGRG